MKDETTQLKDPELDKPPLASETAKLAIPPLQREAKAGLFIIYRDFNGVDHVALITAVGHPDGTINLVAMATHKGDEAVSFEQHVRYAGILQNNNTWRWPDEE